MGFDFFICFFCALFCFLFTYYSTRVILNISIKKRLFASTNHRSSHISNVTNLGGIPIFLGVVSVAFFNDLLLGDSGFNRLLLSLLMLFFVGIKDDLIAMEAYPKLLVQMLASVFAIVLYNLFTVQFYYFVVPSLNIICSVTLSLLFFVMIINSYNLIDGIDGLAGLTAILIALVCGFAAIISDNPSLLLLCLGIIGSVAAFLLFNFSDKRKVFMGDTGSLVVGFLLSFIVVVTIKRSVALSDKGISTLSIYIPMALSGLLFLTIFDTVRVMWIRIFRLGVSPFKADKNHLHHHLLRMGFSHKKASMLLTLSNILLGILFVVLHIDYHYIFYAPILILLLMAFYRLRCLLLKLLVHVITLYR
ncbi:glycosyltransferase family 4 protein [Flavobacterium sp. AG291]|uniref:glycosyltransferase family 4 protein n=1 Tax=Flavobacterium sp. AG291 TaxID=2184000 RepID=UPI000E0A856D|nr:MraY family glycosyltransferase [Flavobacterium sp. AG291]RDI11231.1 UDP-N-acetylmuramyl pentapeptide phosphotransferase/UDP-N-acetylglucosamine-1-phosphate transferase [Flavobacterium sp. AG291]